MRIGDFCQQEKKASLCQHARKMATSGGLGDMNGNVLSLLTNSCKELLFCLKSRPLVAVQTGEKTWREGKGAFRDRAREQVRGQRTPGHSVTSVRVKRTPSHLSQVTMRTSQSRSGQTLSHISQVAMKTSCILYCNDFYNL